MAWHRFTATTTTRTGGVYLAGVAYDLAGADLAALPAGCSRPCPPPWDAQADPDAVPAEVRLNALARRRLTILGDIRTLRKRGAMLTVRHTDLAAVSKQADDARKDVERNSDPLNDRVDPTVNRRYWEAELARAAALSCHAELALTNIDINDLTTELARINAAVGISEWTNDDEHETTDAGRPTTDDRQATNHDGEDRPDVRPRAKTKKGRDRKAR